MGSRLLMYKIMYEPSPSGILTRMEYSNPIINKMDGKLLMFHGISVYYTGGMDLLMLFNGRYKDKLGFQNVSGGDNLFQFSLTKHRPEEQRDVSAGRPLSLIHIPDIFTMESHYINIFLTYLVWGVTAALIERGVMRKPSRVMYEVIVT